MAKPIWDREAAEQTERLGEHEEIEGYHTKREAKPPEEARDVAVRPKRRLEVCAL